MAWTKRAATTAHTCGGPKFGKRTPGCPRCDELAAGAAPVTWSKPPVVTASRSVCGRYEMCKIVCVCGDW